MRDAPPLTDRLHALAARAEQARGRSGDLTELEDILATGYARALAGEARMMQLEQALDDLLDGEAEHRARELRLVVAEHRALERAVSELRSALARLQADFVALGGAQAR